jgi:hypothetical protein
VRPELETLQETLAKLACETTPQVLAEHPGQRCVARVGDLVVKAFAPVKEPASRRETSGLRALAGMGLTAEVVASGPLWTASRWVDGVSPMKVDVEIAALHVSLGQHLARLHQMPPSGMDPWPVVDRLRERIQTSRGACPPSMLRSVARMVEPWLTLTAEGGHFVHGDWGLSNILIAAENTTRMLAVVGFEDSHLGDPAEDSSGRFSPAPAQRSTRP